MQGAVVEYLGLPTVGSNVDGHHDVEAGAVGGLPGGERVVLGVWEPRAWCGGPTVWTRRRNQPVDEGRYEWMMRVWTGMSGIRAA